MNGTSGMMPKMAHASFGPRAMSLRDARSIHMRTTAMGWKKQRRSSRSFFIARIYRGRAGPPPGIRDEASGSAGAGFPAEVARRVEQPGQPPGGHDEHVGPVERGADETGLHAVGEVLDREDPGDPQDPGRRVVAERDEDPGQEQQRQDGRVDDRRR